MDEDKKPFDAGDEAKVSKSKTKAKLEEERQVEELRVVLSTEGGRNVVWRMLSMAGMFNSPIGETNDIIRSVGRPDMGREILGDIFTSDPNAYILMQQEAKERNL